PCAGEPAKRILVMESINDAQVPNIATRVLVRSMGLTGLDLGRRPFAVPAGAGPLDSAYTQWGVRPANVPPVENRPLANDNGAHGAILGIDQGYTQGAAVLTPTGRGAAVGPGGEGVCPPAQGPGVHS